MDKNRLTTLRDTHIYRAIQNDHLVDWLDNFYGTGHKYVPRAVSKDLSFPLFVSEKHERMVACYLTLLKSKCPTLLVARLPKALRVLDERTQLWLDRSEQAMNKPNHVVAFAAFRSSSLAKDSLPMVVSPTLLIRRPVAELIQQDKLSCETLAACQDSTDWVLVNLHFATLALKSNGKELLSTRETRYHLCQTLLQLNVLRAEPFVSRFKITQAHVMGRASFFTHKTEDQDATITERTIDCRPWFAVPTAGPSFIKLQSVLKEALSWLHKLWLHGHEWRAEPIPSVPELWPNMCVATDWKWSGVKKAISKRLGELTELWHVSFEKRKKCHLEHKIFSIPNLEAKHINSLVTPAFLGTVHKMMQLSVSSPDTLSSKIVDLGSLALHDLLPNDEQEHLRVYLDFETVSSVADTLESFPYACLENRIAMCGVFIETDSKDLTVRVFTVADMTNEAEKSMLHSAFEFISSHAKHRPIRAYCWSRAEDRFLQGQYNSAMTRLQLELPKFVWLDLHAVLVAKQVVVRDAWNYSLKTVAKALTKHGQIPIEWPDSEIDNGLSAMVAIIRSAQLAPRVSLHLSQIPWMREVEAYNRIDVLAMYHIVRYLASLFVGFSKPTEKKTN